MKRRICFILAVSLVVCASAHARAADVLLEHYDVFAGGEVIDGLSYDTYRIPNIARANDGTLIAVAEARLFGASDPGGTHIDLVYKRSFDGGKTWSAGRVLDRHPDTILDGNDVPTNRTSASNSVTFVNRATGRIWNLNLRLPNATPAASAQPGVDDMQTWARYSDDSGATWSTPTRILGNTGAIPYEDFYPNLGSATQLSSGRLVVPATEIVPSAPSRSFALYSDDGGATWSAGARVDAGTNEAQIAELTDGRLLMTARQNGGSGRRFAISNDSGATWEPTYVGFSSTTVMEAIERYTSSGVDGESINRLLHTRPAGGSVHSRTNLEILTATDETEPGGPTFGSNRRVIHGWSAYSDLVNIDGDEFGVFWERGDTGNNQKITYTRANRAFLEPGLAQFGLIAHEGFDYDPGRTLDRVDPPLMSGEDYEDGFAPVNFSSRTDLDLIFTLDMNTGGGAVTIDPGISQNDQASGILGQIFKTEAEAGAVSQITVQRAPNGTAGPPVYLHVYSDTDVSDGIDAGSFLGASLTSEDLGPTNLGITTWNFDGVTTSLSPNTDYLFAFANSASPGDTTVARAALNVAPNSAGYALGGNGFNSAWHEDAVDLTNGPGASDARVAAGSLSYSNWQLPATGNHVELDGGATLARGLGVGLDLNSSNSFYLSLLVTRSADAGFNDANDEALHIDLLDSGAASQVRFGVGDDESFFLNGPGGLASTAPSTLDVNSTYLLVLKIVSQDDDSGNHDQVFLKAFESGDAIPDYDDDVVWTLTGSTDENLDALVDRLQITSGASALWSIDELRVGGDFGSVASGAPLVITGDLNLDGDVTLADWVAFKANVNLETSALGATAQTIAGDFNHSGRVGLEDYARFAELFDAANGTGAFQAALNVPEPTAIAMAIASFLGALPRRPAKCP